MTVPLYGLVLRGGESRRMQEEKAELVYHDQPEAQRLAALLGEVCESVYFSVKPGDSGPLNIEDPERHTGPLAGILSAFERFAEVAWIVVPCDMPGLDLAALQALIAARDEARVATPFLAADGEPEPLVCIYEPRIRAALLAAQQEGQMSPRRCLVDLAVDGLVPTDPAWLVNINKPNEREAWLKKKDRRRS